MSPKPLHPEVSHSCSDPACGSPEAEGAKTAGKQSGLPGCGPMDRAPRGAAFWGPVKRWGLWFLAFFGIYSASAVCPFCGTPGCPVGAGGAALVGGVFATLWQYGAHIFRKCKEVAKNFSR